MKLRTTPYTPSPSSDVYPCGRPIRLLRASMFHWAALTARFQALKAQADGPTLKAEHMAIAVMVYILWDDEEVEWGQFYDADTLLEMPDAELVDVGLTLAKELYSVSTLRLGVVVDALTEQFVKNLQGERPNAEPLSSQTGPA